MKVGDRVRVIKRNISDANTNLMVGDTGTVVEILKTEGNSPTDLCYVKMDRADFKHGSSNWDDTNMAYAFYNNQLEVITYKTKSNTITITSDQLMDAQAKAVKMMIDEDFSNIYVANQLIRVSAKLCDILFNGEESK